MNKITKIHPLGNDKEIDISEIEIPFLKSFKINKQPEVLLDDTLKRINKKDGYVLRNDKQRNIIKYLIKEFDNIILSKPIQLEEIINLFKKNRWDIEIKNDKEPKNAKIKRGTFKDELLRIFGYENRFRDGKKRGIWFAQQLNIKSCPYCNAQYTIIATKNDGGKIAKFQFDHFFPKSEYPYLSISLYNLIPSCANCNITKSKKTLELSKHYHPYYNDFAIKSKFYLKYNPSPKKLQIKNIKTQKLEVEFKPKFIDKDKLIYEHDKIYDITGVYNRHKDIAEDLLTSAILYNSAKKHYLSIEGLFPTKELFKKYLIGTYIEPKSILKRPLTKFRQDIAKQLDLLK